MNDEVYVISTNMLFDVLNINRQNKGISEIENTLIARKLGILFIFKTNDHLNFYEDMVKLTGAQLTALQEILDYYFDVDMADDIRAFAITQEYWQEEPATNSRHKPSSSANTVDFVSKIKRFLRPKTEIQESHVIPDGITGDAPAS